MIRLLKRFLGDRKGATAIEYALIVTILGVGIVVSLQGVGEQLRNLFGSMVQGFQKALGA